MARGCGAALGLAAFGELWFLFTQHSTASAVIMLGLGATLGSVWLGWIFSGNDTPRQPPKRKRAGPRT